MISASDWRPLTKNTLQGFVIARTLKLDPSGLVLRECSLREKNGQRWLALPSKPQIDSEGRHRKDAATVKPPYSPVVEIDGKEERIKSQRAALAAVDELLGRGTSPP